MSQSTFPELTDAERPDADELEEQQNDNIMQTFCYHGVFKPEECERFFTAPRDLELSKSFLAAQRHQMDGFDKFMHCQPELIAVNQETAWLHRYLQQMMIVLNQRHYHFDLKRAVGAQIVRLTPQSSLDWHFDLGQGMFSYRKLSMVVYLSPPENYEGGVLEVMSHGLPRVKRPQGSLAIFPSYCASRFTPVLSGQMDLLLVWMHGEKVFT